MSRASTWHSHSHSTALWFNVNFFFFFHVLIVLFICYCWRSCLLHWRFASLFWFFLLFFRTLTRFQFGFRWNPIFEYNSFIFLFVFFFESEKSYWFCAYIFRMNMNHFGIQNEVHEHWTSISTIDGNFYSKSHEHSAWGNFKYLFAKIDVILMYCSSSLQFTVC